MGAEENYLDNLLKSVTEPKETEETEPEETQEETSAAEESVADEPVTDELKTTVVIETLDTVEASDETGGIDAPENPDIELPEGNIEEELNLADIGDLEVPDVEQGEESEDAAFQIDDLESVSESEVSDELSIDDIDAILSDELSIADIDLSASDELSIDDIDADMADALKIEDMESTEELIPEENASEPAEEAGSDELNLSTPEESVSEDVEPEMPVAEEAVLEPVEAAEPEVLEEINLENVETEITEELNLEAAEPEPETSSEELRLGELDLEGLDDDIPDIPDLEEEAADKIGVDGELEDVLSMLDDDADLAEINDILKKSDNKEPIQDEMMDLLNQMADDEAELVNAGVKDVVEDDGVPLPQMPIKKKTEEAEEEDNKDTKDTKKKKKEKENKEPGAVGKFLNMLTEDLPGPTEEEYAAEDAAKAAKKQEAKDKKEQEKLAKDEEKKAKAEEKAAAKKAKADAAAQKKKEKDAAKAAKAEAKRAKQLAEAAKRAKRIPPKKIAVVAVFGASVLGAVIVSTTTLSNQGYINVAKKAFYDGDYKSVYLATYGMELHDSDGLIQAKSEVILKMQCWYDSYQNNLKLHRQREALDALIRGVESYDHINAEAEQYGVLSEVDGIKNTILNVLETEYGLSEAQVRELLQYDDALAYTIALNDIITGE